jgi:hypothetical protein
VTPTSIPFRLSADGRTATWNPGLTRATQVELVVRSAAGVERRRTMNSGRARVREGERIDGLDVLHAASGGAADPLPDTGRDLP